MLALCIASFTGQYILLNSDKTSVYCLDNMVSDLRITNSYNTHYNDVTLDMSQMECSILDGLNYIKLHFTSCNELNSSRAMYVISKLNYLVYSNDKGETQRWSRDENFSELNDSTTRLRKVIFTVTQVVSRAYIDYFFSQCIDQFIILERDDSDNPDDNYVVSGYRGVYPPVRGNYINKYVNFRMDSSLCIARGLDCLRNVFIRQNMPIGTTKPVYRIVKVNYLDYAGSSLYDPIFRYSNEDNYHLYNLDNHIHCISFIVEKVS
jgi:hypothetical protein